MSPALSDRARSLNLEHVSPTQLVRSGISHPKSSGHQAGKAVSSGPAAMEQATLALMRRWFWMRKPDAGFVLADYPATLLQAKVFDEWLEARGEILTAGLVSDPASAPAAILDHYHNLGLDLLEADSFLNN